MGILGMGPISHGANNGGKYRTNKRKGKVRGQEGQDSPVFVDFNSESRKSFSFKDSTSPGRRRKLIVGKSRFG